MDFLWDNDNDGEHNNSKKEEEIFNKLSFRLKEKILLQTNGKILFPLPLFSKNFTKSFLMKILSKMKPIHFEPNTIIYQVYFIYIKFIIIIIIERR